MKSLFYLLLLSAPLFNFCEAVQKVIPALIKDVTILHPLNEIRDLSTQKWPILLAQFDIGTVCLQSEGLSEKNDGLFNHKFNVGSDPECQQLTCPGPYGPVQTWSRHSVLRHLSHCVSLSFSNTKDNQLEIDFAKIPTKPQVHGPGSKAESLPITINLDINDPSDKLGSILTPEEDRIVHFSKSQFHSALMLTTYSFMQGNITFCMFTRDMNNKQFEADPHFNDYYDQCTLRCKGDGEGEPSTWSDEDLLDSLWACLGRDVINLNKQTFFIERDAVRGKIVLRKGIRGQRSDDLNPEQDEKPSDLHFNKKLEL